ncbi:SGNH/GDSL hydrolase family protein [Microtetraspora sp. AC03309]|uniref:SGNH/GDSL hydrolase family protein n=1 Tax=Microtetraspora sp. AC03309 TaxID=2779376 RepID=UPI001E29ACD2|nr:SGNH/GDSL hydrolase family protein [Microtetraspora sp. AC03309]MCC5578860.1 SGNH/GDSL hydrolase family protein [Microtetraspora sp. AC03309]
MRRPVHRLAMAVVVMTGVMAGVLPLSPAAAESRHLVGTWSAASDRLTTDDRLLAPIGGQTIRMVARTSVGGSGLRIRLSNVFGVVPVTFKSVHLGLQAYGAEIVGKTNRPLTFGGRASVTIRPGQAVWSDALPGKITGRQDVVISAYVPTTVEQVTGHDRAYATTYLSTPGNHAAGESGEAFTTTSLQWYFLDRIAVTADGGIGSVVALGDSITDGTGQGNDANRRWTDYLYQRVGQLPAKKRVGVLNVGIAGNRVLYTGVGPSALSRFKRDALSQPGARTIVVLEGINDISRGEYTSAKPLIEAYKKMIKLAHAKKLRILGGTLTPFYGYSTWTEEREEIRQEVNAWIRTGKAFDGVIDFDKAVRDPAYPAQLAAAYDHGDHIHLSDAGRRRLAYTVRLSHL